MTWLRAIWSVLTPIAICRQEPQTIAEMRIAAFTSAGPRYRQTQPSDPKKLRGERARRKVRNFAEWSARYDVRKRA